MSSMSNLFFCWAWLLLLPQPPQQMSAITSAEAKHHIGETVKVCGRIATIYEPRRSKRNPTFLNFDKPYPQVEFTAIIWQQARAAFGNLPAWIGKPTCVTGVVREYRGRAQMTLTHATNLQREKTSKEGNGRN